MRILIVDSCAYTFLGTSSFLADYPHITLQQAASPEQALQMLRGAFFDVVLVNLTHHCRCSGPFPSLADFFLLCGPARVYIYLDAPYPTSTDPIPLSGRVALMNKHGLTALLPMLTAPCQPGGFITYTNNGYLFTRQELAVIVLWIDHQKTNHQIAQQLGICGRTVYVHKRHATQKLAVRNRLEFCSLYPMLKYVIFPPAYRRLTDNSLLAYLNYDLVP